MWNLNIYMYELRLNYSIFLLWYGKQQLLKMIIQSYVCWHGLMFTIHYYGKRYFLIIYDWAQVLLLSVPSCDHHPPHMSPLGASATSLFIIIPTSAYWMPTIFPLPISILALLYFNDLFMCPISPLEWKFLERGDGFICLCFQRYFGTWWVLTEWMRGGKESNRKWKMPI